MKKIDLASLPMARGSSYPAPFDRDLSETGGKASPARRD